MLTDRLIVSLTSQKADYSASARMDLPVHDFYSFILGVLIVHLSLLSYGYLQRFWSKPGLVRKNSIRRGSGRNRNIGGLVGVPEDTEGYSKAYIWWRRKGRYQTVLALKGAYLFIFFGILLPVSFGLAVDVYLLAPLKYALC
jgi:hypothetical protein